MGWGKPFSKNGWGTKLAKVGAVVAGSMLGGPAGGAAAGAAVGGMGGGGLKGAAIGGVLGGASGLLAGGLGTAAGAPMTGGMQGATQGSGLAGLLTGGGQNLGSVLSGAGASSFSNGMGTTAGTPMATGQGATQGSGVLGGLTGGSFSNGVIGAPQAVGFGDLFGGGNAASSAVKSISPTSKAITSPLSSMAKSAPNVLGKMKTVAKYAMPASSLLSGIQTYGAQGEAEDELLEGRNRALGLLNPYNASGLAANEALTAKLASGELGGAFNPGDLTSTPGYKFALQQGEQALDRQQAASGNYYSGAALKAAQDYGTGLASQTYGDEYNRWLQSQNNTYNMLSNQAANGQHVAGQMGDVYGDMGTYQAEATKGKSNTINQTVAALLSGSGAIGQQKPQFDIYGRLINA